MDNLDINLIQKFHQGIATRDADETIQAAKEFASIVPENQIIALYGDLGVGKTTFVRGLAQAWKVSEPVKSPTFNLYTIYKGERQLIHLDAYRLGSDSDLDALMIEDFLAPPWCLAIEWPERIIEALPEDTWHLDLSIRSDKSHHIQLRA